MTMSEFTEDNKASHFRQGPLHSNSNSLSPEDLELDSTLSKAPSIVALSKKEYALSDEGGLSIPVSSPLHPWSWSIGYRIFSIAVYGLTTCTVQFNTTYVTGDIPQVARHFGVGEEVANISFCVFLLGNIVGSIVLTPLSETFGRKVAIFGTNFICGFIVCVTANVDSIAAFTVYRFIAGIFGGAPLAIGPSAMSDVCPPAMRSVAMVLYGAMIILGSTSAPILEALLATNDPSYGLQWGGWLSGILQMSWALLGFFTVRESFVLVLEQNIARDLRFSTGNWRIHGALDRIKVTPRGFVVTHLMRPVRMFFTPTMLCYNLLSSFVYGLYFLLISTVSEVYQEIHQFGNTQSQIPLYSLLLGWIIGGSGMIAVGQSMAQYAAVAKQPPPPEMILRAMMPGIPILSAGCFVYGWTFYSYIHWIVPCVGLLLVGVGFCLVFGASLVYIVQCYTTPRVSYGASAIGANMILRSALSGTFPLFATQMYKNLNVHWASSLLGFLLAIAIPIPFVFYFYGERIRSGDRIRQEMENL